METIPDLEKINVYPLYLFTLCANGNIDDAAMIANIIAPNYPVNEENLRLFTWLHSTFGMPLPNVYIN